MPAQQAHGRALANCWCRRCIKSSLRGELESAIDDLIDRPLEQLDPVERAVLLIGVYELQSRLDVPYRVVINEGVNLAKRFGALDGHKYINACLDKAAQSFRSVEVQA